MLATNHVLAGAVIGVVTRNPAVAFAAGVASHVLMDLVPHWGPRRDGSAPRRFEPTFLAVAKTDGILLLFMGAVCVLAAPAGAAVSVGVGAFGALLLDLDKPYEHFFGRFVGHRPLWGRRWLALNERFQPEHHSRWWVELLGFIAAAALFFNLVH